MKRKRILLADRDESVRKLIGRVLESEDYEVLLAESGWEAANKTLTGSPDLVLLDAEMLERDGRQAFDMIRRLQPHAPVIGMSVRRVREERVVPDGVDVFMEKPLDLQALLKTIQGLLRETPAEHGEGFGQTPPPPNCASQTA